MALDRYRLKPLIFKRIKPIYKLVWLMLIGEFGLISYQLRRDSGYVYCVVVNNLSDVISKLSTHR